MVVNDGNKGLLIVYNPTIQQYRKLPNPNEFQITKEAIGIGFDKKINDYKVVRVPSNYCNWRVKGYKPRVEVLELKTNSWRQISDDNYTPPYFVEHIFQSTKVNGGMYWLTQGPRTSRSLIMRFDLAEEKLGVVASPPEEFGRDVTWIGALKDVLCAVHTRGLAEVHVWGTNDDKTWIKMRPCSKFREFNDQSNVYSDTYCYMPLCYNEKDGVLMSITGEGFLTFDDRINLFEHVDILGAEDWLQETMYCESLVSPGAGVHPTEAAASSGDVDGYVTAEDEADEKEVKNGSSIVKMMCVLKRELANLLACTVDLRHVAQE